MLLSVGPGPDRAEIIDAMALIQSIPAKLIPQTYGELANVILTQVLSSRASRTDFVADVYSRESIKATEREKRSGEGVVNVTVSAPSQRCTHQWKKVY